MNLRLSLVLVPLVLFGMISPESAKQEEPELKLKVKRDFGFGGGSTIQGRFTLTAEGPDDLVRVIFLIDDEVMVEDSEKPFKHSFSTGEYPLGEHSLQAVGTLASGVNIRSNERTYTFISAEEGWGLALRIVVPILVVTIGLTVLAGVGTAVLGRGKSTFELGKYGPAGGAVCPRCGNPFSRNILAPNLVVGKLGRCPHCGKWSIVRRASREHLSAAEAKWSEDQLGVKQGVGDEKDRLRRMIEESKFDEG